MKQITLDEATDMAMNTDYACFAVGEKINKADAGAFFLEGYEYANKKNEELTSKFYKLEEKYDELVDESDQKRKRFLDFLATMDTLGGKLIFIEEVKDKFLELYENN